MTDPMDPDQTHAEWQRAIRAASAEHETRRAALLAEQSTQQKWPWRAAIRTGTQVLVSALAVLIVAIPLALEHFGGFLAPEVVAWLTGAVAVLTAVSTFLARLMAAEPVIEFVARFLPWLAPAPTDN